MLHSKQLILILYIFKFNYQIVTVFRQFVKAYNIPLEA